MHNLSQTLLDAFRKLPVAVTIAVMMFAPASHVSLAEAPEAPKIVNFANLNKSSAELTEEEKAILAAKIDKFYADRKLPLAGHGNDFVDSAVKYDLVKPALTAAIALVESTGGKFACKKDLFNAFGWGSCRKNHGFTSWEDSIDHITAHLAGEKSSTQSYYNNKTVDQILDAYNPPSIVPDYKERVKGVMKMIEDTELS
jgi:hypothetical protein